MFKNTVEKNNKEKKIIVFSDFVCDEIDESPLQRSQLQQEIEKEEYELALKFLQSSRHRLVVESSRRII